MPIDRTTLPSSQLTDKDQAYDALIMEKYGSHLYDHLILESSDENLRNVVRQLQRDKQQHVQMLSTVMAEQGWYGVPAITGERTRIETRAAAREAGIRLTPRTRLRRRREGESSLVRANDNVRHIVRSGWQTL